MTQFSPIPLIHGDSETRPLAEHAKRMGNRYEGENVFMGGNCMKTVVFDFSQESQHQNSGPRLGQSMIKINRADGTYPSKKFYKQIHGTTGQENEKCMKDLLLK